MIEAINASTTYGMDTSAENNYGLGPGFESTLVMQSKQAQRDAAPSWLWLLGFIVLVKVLV